MPRVAVEPAYRFKRLVNFRQVAHAAGENQGQLALCIASQEGQIGKIIRANFNCGYTDLHQQFEIAPVLRRGEKRDANRLTMRFDFLPGFRRNS